jgi:hypothetical protein
MPARVPRVLIGRRLCENAVPQRQSAIRLRASGLSRIAVAVTAGSATRSCAPGAGIHVFTQPRREADGERPQARGGEPVTRADELVESRVQLGRVRRGPERRVGVVSEADDGLGPGPSILRIAASISPEDGTALVCEFSGKRGLQLDEAVSDETHDVTAAERTVLLYLSHVISRIIGAARVSSSGAHNNVLRHAWGAPAQPRSARSGRLG